MYLKQFNYQNSICLKCVELLGFIKEHQITVYLSVSNDYTHI